MAGPGPGLQRWRLLVAYDGSGFHGFAGQPGQPDVPTVAGALATALERAARLGEPPHLVCAGRTDAGVHAEGQVVHVDLPAALPPLRRGSAPMGPEDLVRAVNRQTAPSLVVRDAVPAGDGFDARRSATSRRYRYLVHEAPVPDPLLTRLAWHVPGPLDLKAMIAATDPVVGTHDFRAFCRRPPGTEAGTPLTRRVTRASWREGPAPSFGRLLRLDITADSFCHQMVRSLVAAMVAAGLGRGNAATVMAHLRAADRTGMPRPAPPEGLCLEAVTYGP